MKNFRIADIDRDAAYTVTTTDKQDGTTDTKTMTGANLVSLYNAAAHLYNFNAQKAEEGTDETEEGKDTRNESGASVDALAVKLAWIKDRRAYRAACGIRDGVGYAEECKAERAIMAELSRRGIA